MVFSVFNVTSALKKGLFSKALGDCYKAGSFCAFTFGKNRRETAKLSLVAYSGFDLHVQHLGITSLQESSWNELGFEMDLVLFL